MPKRFKLCIIHIGTEKTGTSSVQSFLSINRKALSRCGIYYPLTTTTQQGSQWEFVAVHHKTPWTMDVGKACGIHNAEDQIEFRKQFTEELNRQFAGHPNAETLIISSEHFHSRLSTDQMISDFRDYLSPWVENFKIIVYFRRQDRLAMSYYSTRIKSGAPITALLLPYQGPEKRYFDYKWIYETWTKYFGTGVVIPRIYERCQNGEHGIIEDFCVQCGIDIRQMKRPVWLNTSVNAKGISLIHAAHNFFGKIRSNDDNTLLAQFIQDVTETHKGRFFPAGRQDAENFYAQFQDDNAWIKSTAFPDHQGPLFDNDFTHYPERPDSLPEVFPKELHTWLQTTKSRMTSTPFENALNKLKSLARRMKR